MRRKTIEDMILPFENIHKGKYDYSKSIYISNRIKIEIVCPIHGSFFQEPSNHIKGHGCPSCSKNKKLDTNKFIFMSNELHGDLYDYDKVNYRNNSTPVTISCKKHGYFKQSPSKHLSGHGCPECGGSIVLDNNEFEKRSKLVHGNRYIYSMVDYKNAKTKVKIICKVHGEFMQKPNNHLSGYGCLICKSSKGEIKIFNILTDMNVKFIKEYHIRDINSYIDFFIPSKNIAIEYDGIQHFIPIKFFGGEKSFELNKIRDELKNKYCDDNNIKMYRISYKENIEKELLNILNNLK